MNKTHGLTVLAVGLVLTACPARKPVEPAPEDPVELSLAPGQPITIGLVQAVVAQVVPLVEVAAGRRFDEVPFAGLGTPESLAAINLEDQLAVLRAVHPDLPEAVLHRMARSMSVHTDGIVGKYAMGGKGRLYVAAASLDRMVDVGHIAPEERLDVLRLVLAHELVHGLQDEALGGMEVFTRHPTVDGLQIARALTEGQAMWVEHQVAVALDLEELYWRQVEDGQGWGREGLQSPLAFPIWWAYGQGYQTMAWHDQQGGTQAIWELLQTPPQSTASILWPDWEGPVLTQPMDGLLEGMEADLTRGVWLTQEGPVGAYHLAAATAGMDPAPLREPLEHLVGGRVREALRDDRSSHAWIMRFDEPRWAQELMELLPASVDAREELAREQGPSMHWHEVVAPWDQLPQDLPADEALYLVGSPAGAWGVTNEAAAVWMRRGDTVVAVSVTGFRPGLRWGSALAGIWERLDEADQ